MKRTIDGVVVRKHSFRTWQFRKKVPELELIYTAPSPTVFSSWTKRLGVFVALFLGPAVAFSVSTHAEFTNESRLHSNGIGTGEWIPDIHLKERKGCIRLASSLRSAIIYYKFSHDGDPRTNGTISDGECLDIPRGKTVDFEAIAFHPDNDAWRSAVLKQTFSRKEDSHEKESDRDENETIDHMNCVDNKNCRDSEHESENESEDKTDIDAVSDSNKQSLSPYRNDTDDTSTSSNEDEYDESLRQELP